MTARIPCVVSEALRAVIHDRYELAGLRGNPFVVIDHASELASAHFVDRGLATPPPPGSATLVQVIGDQGAGKTTHVQHWRRMTPGPYHYVPRYPYRRRWVRAPVAPLVYADEIDRMPYPLRWQWFRQAAAVGTTIVAGTHVDLTRKARRAGLKVMAHHLGPVDRSTLGAIVERRIAAATLPRADAGEAARFRFSSTDLDFIYAKSGGVLRTAEGVCHELLAERLR